MNSSVVYIDHMGDDNSIVNAARVSFNKDAAHFTPEQNANLIRYLATHGHWTPFAHAVLSLRFTAPIAIHAQCVKHQIGFAMNTVSRRYVSDTPDYIFPVWRSKPTGSIKQGSGGIVTDGRRTIADDLYYGVCIDAINAYDKMVNELDIAPEQARFILPQGVFTEWVWTGSLQAWARFYNQRSDPHAQQEIQELAKMVDDIISPLFPVSWEHITNKKDD